MNKMGKLIDVEKMGKKLGLAEIAESSLRTCPFLKDRRDCEDEEKGRRPNCNNGNYLVCSTYQMIMEIRT